MVWDLGGRGAGSNGLGQAFAPGSCAFGLEAWVVQQSGSDPDVLEYDI